MKTIAVLALTAVLTFTGFTLRTGYTELKERIATAQTTVPPGMPQTVSSGYIVSSLR